MLDVFFTFSTLCKCLLQARTLLCRQIVVDVVHTSFLLLWNLPLHRKSVSWKVVELQCECCRNGVAEICPVLSCRGATFIDFERQRKEFISSQFTLTSFATFHLEDIWWHKCSVVNSVYVWWRRNFSEMLTSYYI